MPSAVILIKHYGVLNEVTEKETCRLVIFSIWPLNPRSLLNDSSVDLGFPFEIMSMFD